MPYAASRRIQFPWKNPSRYGVKIVVPLTVEQYDALYAHCVATGKTMGAFCRESAVAAIDEESSDCSVSTTATGTG